MSWSSASLRSIDQAGELSCEVEGLAVLRGVVPLSPINLQRHVDCFLPSISFYPHSKS